MLSTTLTHDQIMISPLNVRLKLHDAAALQALGESILAKGLRVPLEVHPMHAIGVTGPDADKFGAFAGGGRWRSIGRLIERGELPADWPIRVELHDDLSKGQIVLNSLVENDIRYRLQDFETYSAVVRAQGLGQSIDEIAQALGGRDPMEILRWLRLGQLARVIFDAFAAGRLSIDQAEAYAATDDRTLQVAAFEALKGGMPWQHKPSDIRAWMKFNDPVAERELLFVGEKAYAAAGGALQPDLFAAQGEQRRRIVHPQLLRKLVDEKLASLKEDLRRRADRDVRFVVAPPKNDFNTNDHFLLVDPREGDGDAIVLPDGDIVGCVVIDEVGRADVTWWWSSRTAKYGDAKGAPADRLAAAARPTAKPANPLPAPDPASDAAAIDGAAIEILRSQRRAILRAAMVDDARAGGTTAGDYLVFAQLRLLIHPGSHQRIVGMPRLLLESGPESTRQYVASMPATKTWGDAVSELSRRPMLSLVDEADAWLAFVDEPAEIRELAAAVVTGLAIDRALATEELDNPLHDLIAARVGLTDDAAIRRYWLPTDKLLDRLPIAQRLAIAEPFVESAEFGPWSRLKPAALTRQLLAVVTGAGEHVRHSMRDAAAAWVHPLLRFVRRADGPEWPPAADVAAEMEAAE